MVFPTLRRASTARAPSRKLDTSRSGIPGCGCCACPHWCSLALCPMSARRCSWTLGCHPPTGPVADMTHSSRHSCALEGRW